MIDSFEDTTNWTHTVTVYDAATGKFAGTQEVGNIFVPRGWGFFFLHGPCTHDPQNTNGWSQPEASHIPATVDPVRVHTGAQGYKSFGFYRIVDCGLSKKITGLKAGQRIRVTAWAHAWTGNGDDPRTSEGVGTAAFAAPVGTLGLSDATRNATFRIGITTGTQDAGPYANETITWGIGWHIYNRYAQLSVEAIAEGPEAIVYLRGSTLWPYKHNDLYWDDVEIIVEDAEEPEPEPPTGCAALPRVDYVRTMNVVPGSSTKERFLQIAQIAWERGRQSITGSYDDAGRRCGNTESTAVLWDIPYADRVELEDWFEHWYPGTIVRFDGDGGEIPDPEDPGEPEPVVLASDNVLGLHSGFIGAKSWEYIDRGVPTVQKFFSAGDTYQAGLRNADLITVWRKYVDAFPTKPTAREEAQWYLDQYTAEINVAAQALGISIYGLLSCITAIESKNEVIGSNALDGLKYAVEFDVAFAELLASRYGDNLVPVLLNVAVGNPLESEVQYLLPAAQAAEKYDGYIGYHSYWAANTTQSYLASGWPYHAGRWMEWDKVFTAAGCYPKYIQTEGGACFAADGWAFDPNRGWKACGPFDAYLPSLLEYRQRVLDWNKLHANRCAGLTIFCYAQWGWDSFLLGDGDVMALMDAVVGMPARAEALSRPSQVAELDMFIDSLQSYLADINYLTEDRRERLQKDLKAAKRQRKLLRRLSE